MKTYFARHTIELDVDDDTRARLWNERIVAIHYPEDQNGVIGSVDNASVEPNDYTPNAGINIRALRELAADGGYVLAEYNGQSNLLAGRVDPESRIELVEARWGSNTGRPRRVAVLKALRLQDVVVVSPSELGDTWNLRPPRATLRRWPRAGNTIAYIVDGVVNTGEDVNHWQRAYLAWDELVDYANAEKNVTYQTLGNLIGIHHRAVKHVLSVIQDYCLNNQLPPLTILVVNKQTGLPGEGFIAWSADNLEEGREQVYAYGWTGHGNPFLFAARGARTDDVVKQLVAHPDRAADIYAVSRVRGSAQLLFREALLEVYGRACAFCGSTVVQALEAAHLVPWRNASAQERLDVRNGILLTSWHHRLFDSGLLTITSDFKIRADVGLLSSSAFDVEAAAKLHDTSLRLPRDPRLHPDPKFIARRNELLTLGSNGR